MKQLRFSFLGENECNSPGNTVLFANVGILWNWGSRSDMFQLNLSRNSFCVFWLFQSFSISLCCLSFCGVWQKLRLQRLILKDWKNQIFPVIITFFTASLTFFRFSKKIEKNWLFWDTLRKDIFFLLPFKTDSFEESKGPLSKET